MKPLADFTHSGPNLEILQSDFLGQSHPWAPGFRKEIRCKTAILFENGTKSIAVMYWFWLKAIVMSIQPAYIPPASPVLTQASRSSDPQVQKIMAEIKDWEGCPTTDPKTKKQKVDSLEQQLSSVEAGLSSRGKLNQELSPTTGSSAKFNGLGSKLDLVA